ncbi:MAG: hypothetical protein V1817_02515 [Candidatus Micrarchaeota archaeon]
MKSLGNGSNEKEAKAAKNRAFFGGGSTRAERLLELIALLVAVGFAFSLVVPGLFEKADFFLPTYDNSMLHAGRARFVIDTGFYPDRELVFGGVTPTYHVPAYPALVAAFSELSGLNWLWTIRVIALLFAALLPLAVYCLAKRASGGNAFAGAAAAFFVLLTGSLTTWGMRTTPISLGVIAVVMLLYFVIERNWPIVIFGSVMLAFTHQPSLLTFFGSMCVFFVFSNFGAALSFLKKSAAWTRGELIEFAKSLDWLPFAGALAALLPYLAWHISKTGLGCLTLKCLPQGASKEFGEPVNLAEYFGIELNKLAPKLPHALALLGVFWIIIDERIGKREKALLLAWFLFSILLVKNELFGIGVFTQRFVTFFDEAVAVFAGIFVGGIVAFACYFLEKQLSAKEGAGA